MTDATGRILVVGEALVDVVRHGGEDAVHPGGSPLNVAVGLQRLDVPATLHSSFGVDAHGVAIAQHLEASGVTVTPATVYDGATSVALATIAPDGAASYTFSIEWDPAPLDVAPRMWFSCTSGRSVRPSNPARHWSNVWSPRRGRRRRSASTPTCARS
jgi:fructokinase